MAGGTVQRIHLERDDPVAPGRVQVWRGWTTLTGPGQGSVTFEEGQLGGNLKVTEIGQECIGGDPTAHLGQMILDRTQGGWKVVMISDELRYTSQTERRLFQFTAPHKTMSKQLAWFLIERIERMRLGGGESSIDWLTRPSFNDETLTMGFRAPVQVGLDAVEIRIRGDKPVVLSADVPMGSLMETLLLVLAGSTQLPGSAVVTDDQGIPIGDVRAWFRDRTPWMPAWLEDMGVMEGSVRRAPRLKPRTGIAAEAFVL